MITVILVDDHNLMRAGIRVLLDQQERVQVVGEASDGQEGFNLIERLKPDLALVDIAMPGMTGLEMARRIKESEIRTKLIILSMHSSDDVIAQALRAGALGYLLKDSAAAELSLAIEAAIRGEVYLSPAVSKQVVNSFLNPPSEGVAAAVLTPRQRQILILIAQGQSTKQIAYALQVSVKTVETHRSLLMERLGIHDLAGLVRYAIKIGLVQIDS